MMNSANQCCGGQKSDCSSTADIQKAVEEWSVVEQSGSSRSKDASMKAASKSSDMQKLEANELLKRAIDSLLPNNYEFEIYKSLAMIRKHRCRRVALQLPEGLQMYATTICAILEEFSYSIPLDADEPNEPCSEIPDKLETVIMGDVTYGACCIDDFTARALGCDLMIHYGHSCLIPVTTTSIRTLYVFVDIKFNLQHLLETIQLNFPAKDVGMALLGTIQFAGSLQMLVKMLRECGYQNLTIPQIKPLSPGEVLGCTSPRLNNGEQIVLYLGDGRFHLESIMIANPHLADSFYRYDPYCAKLTREYYEHKEMLHSRAESIFQARLPSNKTMGIILGTLGRQGSPAVLNYIRKKAQARGWKTVTVLLSELSPQKLALFNQRAQNAIDVWVQTSCPRLSIDWADAFDRPLLTPYEAQLVLMSNEEFERCQPMWIREQNPVTYADKKDSYPMDFYANDSLGAWTPNHVDPEQQRIQREARRLAWQQRKQKSNQIKQ